jgi:hypothetical protein
VEIGGVYDETKTPSCQMKTGECRPVVEGKPWLRRNIVCTVKKAGSFNKGDQVSMELTGWGPGVGVTYRHGGFGDKSPLGIRYGYDDGRFIDHDENESLGKVLDCSQPGANLKEIAESAANKDGC